MAALRNVVVAQQRSRPVERSSVEPAYDYRPKAAEVRSWH
jgi:hypothetical protein